MEDLSYFEEDVQVLISEEVRDPETNLVIEPAVSETRSQVRGRPQQVTYADLQRIIKKQTSELHLDAKIAMQQETLQWEWYDTYQQYLTEKQDIEQWNVDNAEEPKVLPTATTRPLIITPAIWRLNNYTTLRQASYGTWQDQMEMLYDDQVNGTTKFKDAIAAVKTAHARVGV